MSDFMPELRAVADRLDIPQPMRVRILLELGGDLEDMCGALIEQGAAPAEARRRAVATLLPAPEAMNELVRHHRPFYLHMLDGLADPLRHRLERVGLAVGVLMLSLFGLQLLSNLALLSDPAPTTFPILGLGAGLIGLGLWKTFQLYARRDHRPRMRRRGLAGFPAIAVAAFVLSLGGAVADLYVVAGNFQAQPTDASALLLAWLRRDMAMAALGLIVGSLAIALWIWLSTAVARLEQAEADVLFTFQTPGGKR